ncbi:MAG TPA: GNAT family N-acetyltransferase [Stellaceae bacterium]|nr:GNAT family N-acetyltransferase [Stellaceae bacterium]
MEHATLAARPTFDVVYREEPDLSVEEFVDVLRRSTLAKRRPIDEPERIRRMLAHADITLCARETHGKLVGISRAITDFSYCCYLSELAVDEAWQGRGIGAALLRKTHERAGLGAKLILLSAPEAMSYYRHLRMEKAENAFVIPRKR